MVEQILLAVVLTIAAIAAIALTAYAYWQSYKKKQSILDGQRELLELLRSYNNNVQSSHKLLAAAKDLLEESRQTTAEVGKLPEVMKVVTANVILMRTTVEQFQRALTRRPDRGEDVQIPTEADRSAAYEVMKIMNDNPGMQYDEAIRKYREMASQPVSASSGIFTE